MLNIIISSILLAVTLSIFANYYLACFMSKSKGNKKENQKGDYAFCKIRDFKVVLTDRKFVKKSFLLGKIYDDNLSEKQNKFAIRMQLILWSFVIVVLVLGPVIGVGAVYLEDFYDMKASQNDYVICRDMETAVEETLSLCEQDETCQEFLETYTEGNWYELSVFYENGDTVKEYFIQSSGMESYQEILSQLKTGGHLKKMEFIIRPGGVYVNNS